MLVMKKCLYLVCMAAGLMLWSKGDAQGLLKKVKDKVNKAVDKSLDKKVEEKTGIPSDESGGNSSGNSNSNSGGPTNKGGGGLTNTEPPDVKAQMAEAETAHGAKNYSDARYSLQQALMGVETVSYTHLRAHETPEHLVC